MSGPALLDNFVLALGMVSDGTGEEAVLEGIGWN